MRWSIQTKWSKWLQDMKELEQVAVPRCYFSSLPDSMEKEIHAFCDATKNAYAGVIYIRTVTLSGTAHTSVFKANTRVAPLKTMTLPRLELNGALIAEFRELFAGQTAQLIRGPSGQYKQYVANQVNEINNLTEPQCWRYGPSDDNSADLPSRGITATQLISCSHWWNGPSWLSQPEFQWSADLKTTENVQEEERVFRWWKWTLLTTQNPSLNQKGFLPFGSCCE